MISEDVMVRETITNPIFWTYFWTHFLKENEQPGLKRRTRARFLGKLVWDKPDPDQNGLVLPGIEDAPERLRKEIKKSIIDCKKGYQDLESSTVIRVGEYEGAEYCLVIRLPFLLSSGTPISMTVHDLIKHYNSLSKKDGNEKFIIGNFPDDEDPEKDDSLISYGLLDQKFEKGFRRSFFKMVELSMKSKKEEGEFYKCTHHILARYYLQGLRESEPG